MRPSLYILTKMDEATNLARITMRSKGEWSVVYVDGCDRDVLVSVARASGLT